MQSGEDLMKLRARFGVCILSAALAASAVPATAKDICVSDGAHRHKFKGVKSLKKPGSISALTGLFINGDLVAPSSGTAIVRGDGAVLIGITVHAADTDPTGTGVEFTFQMLGDASFTASGSYRYADDPEIGSLASWTPIDCKTIVVP
jgi:hypothetical protein